MKFWQAPVGFSAKISFWTPLNCQSKNEGCPTYQYYCLIFGFLLLNHRYLIFSIKCPIMQQSYRKISAEA
ncbi:MAG: hypothetical protein GY795_01560 [Desulfobacterales bacterium]|nr:hypothetical protein [Desulfobacterales bacterium]